MIDNCRNSQLPRTNQYLCIRVGEIREEIKYALMCLSSDRCWGKDKRGLGFGYDTVWVTNDGELKCDCTKIMR